MADPTATQPDEGAELLRLPLFQELPPLSQKLLLRYRRYESHPAGAVFVEQGAYSEDLYVVLSGAVSAYRTEPDGTTRLYATMAPGDWFGEVSALSSQPSLASLKADLPVLLLVLDAATFKELYANRLNRRLREAVDGRYRERELALHLRALPLLEGLGAGALERLAARVRFETREKGEALVRQGEPLDAAWFVRTGAVGCTRTEADGRARILGYHLANSSFGEGAFTGQAGSWPGTYEALARTDAIVLGPVDAREALGGDAAALERLTANARRLVAEDAGAAGAGAPEVGAPSEDELEIMVRRQSAKGGAALVIDLERCIRCNACVESCVAVHDDRVPRLSKRGNRLSSSAALVTSCYNCDIPECMLACNYGAIRRDVQGLVRFVWDNCVGCGACVAGCPYGVIRMTAPSDAPPVVPRESLLATLPFLGRLFGTSARAEAQAAAAAGPRLNPRGKEVRGKAVKCDLCAGLPFEACVYNCPTDAIARVEPEELFARRREPRAGSVLPSEVG